MLPVVELGSEYCPGLGSVVASCVHVVCEWRVAGGTASDVVGVAQCGREAGGDCPAFVHTCKGRIAVRKVVHCLQGAVDYCDDMLGITQLYIAGIPCCISDLRL